MTTVSGGALAGELEQRCWVTLCLMNTDRDRTESNGQNVYQGLVMGVFSSDVETKHKKERFCV